MTRLIAVLVALTAAVANAATLNFDFTSSLLYTSGAPVLFTGTLTNTGTSTAFINGDTITSMLPADDSPFLLNAPVSLNAGQSFTGPLFLVSPGPHVTPGLYSGVFSILGGDTPAESNVLSARPFAVQVVPEPATWMAVPAFCPLFLAIRRRSRGAS